MKNRFYIEKNYGFFIGNLPENKLHSHYAAQISIAFEGKLMCIDEQATNHSGKSFFINPQVKHQLISPETHITILINPLSPLGHQLSLSHGNQGITLAHTDLCTAITHLLEKLKLEKITFESFCEDLREVFTDFKCLCEKELHVADDRILKTLNYLDEHFERVVALNELAALSFLSETRFLHLFKGKTGFNLRRYQLWNKLIKSLSYIQTHSITETAHTFGFSDSSHYTKTCQETFGVSPKFLSSSK